VEVKNDLNFAANNLRTSYRLENDMFGWPKKKQIKFTFDFTDVEKEEIQRDYKTLCTKTENRQVSGQTLTIYGKTRPLTVGDLFHVKTHNEEAKCFMHNILREIRLGHIKLK